MKKNILVKIAVISITLLFLLVIGIWLYYRSLIGNVALLKNHYPVYDLKEKAYKLVAEKPAHWVGLKQISKQARAAIVISEDWAFYEHDGIDRTQIEIAIKESIDEGKLKRGASTITQQVIKNALLNSEKSITRKLKEVLLATELEKILTKEQILELYLNLIELGKDIYGIKQASEFYFQKQPIDLNAKEGAFLAMLLPSPVKYAQSYRDKKLTEYASQQVNKILIKMRQAHAITEEEREEFEQKALSFEDVPEKEQSPLELDVGDPSDYDKEENSFKNHKYEFKGQEKEADEILEELEKERLDIDSETTDEY